MANSQLDSLDWQLTWAVHEKISSRADDIIEAIILPAREIQFYDDFLKACAVPLSGGDGGYWPYSLVNGFNAHTQVEGRLMKRFDLESLGIIMRTSISEHVKSEYTWEISSYPACDAYNADYVYVYADETTDSNIVGWCGKRDGTIDGPLLIEADAPRLSPVEEEIFDGVPGTENGAFLPVEFSWVDPSKFTLIYELPFRCWPNVTQEESSSKRKRQDNGSGEGQEKPPVYAATYAEKSLGQIDDILKQAASEEKNSTYYIVEVDSNYLVAASLDNQTITTDKKGQRVRVMFFDAPNPIIRRSAWFLKSKAGAHGLRFFDMPNSYRSQDAEYDLVIYTQPYRSTTAAASGIQWLVVRVVYARSIYGEVDEFTRTVVIVFLVTSFVGIVLILFTVRVCLRAFRTALEDDAVDVGRIVVSELRDIVHNVRNRNQSGTLLNPSLDDISTVNGEKQS